MSDVSLKFIKSGLLTLIQDGGRQGYQAYGVPISGPLDRASAQLANQLVGNKPDAPVLEITLIGPEIEIKGACNIAITGANLSPEIDEVELSLNEPFAITSKVHLKFGKAKYGCRAYLAVGGDWQIRKWLGSASAATHNASQLTPDSVIKKGSVIKINSSKQQLVSPNPGFSPPVFSNVIRVRVIPGPEFENFSKVAIAHFFGSGHRLNADSNRMGYRLSTRINGFKSEKEIISSGIVPGTIQVTNNGQPIILLADAQTTGGYHRIANVIDEDLDALAQLKPGDEVWFSLHQY